MTAIDRIARWMDDQAGPKSRSHSAKYYMITQKVSPVNDKNLAPGPQARLFSAVFYKYLKLLFKSSPWFFVSVDERFFKKWFSLIYNYIISENIPWRWSGSVLRP
jgi:hypothetical protein